MRSEFSLKSYYIKIVDVEKKRRLENVFMVI